MSKVAAKIRNWLGFDVVDDEEIDDIEFEEEQELERKSQGKVVDLPISSNRSKLIVYRPVSYEDTMSIIDNLKSRKPIILNMENIEIDVAQRILDFMSGACSAMGGDIRKVSAKIFAVVPADYEIVGNSDGFKE